MPTFVCAPNTVAKFAVFSAIAKSRYNEPCGFCGTEACTCETTDSLVNNGGASAIQKDILEKFGTPRPWISVGILAREFYGAYYIALTEPDKREAAAEVITRVADDLTGAICAAAGGEARHVLASTAHIFLQHLPETKLKILHEYKWPLRTKYLGAYIQSAITNGKGTRTGGAEAFYTHVVVPHGLTRAVRSLRNMFIWNARQVGRTGYGGAPWASGVSLVLKRLEGDITDAQFCDRAFDLVHNGGSYFNKTNKVPTYLLQWLDNRALASGEWLIRWLPNEARAKLGYYPVSGLPMFEPNYARMDKEFVKDEKQKLPPPITLPELQALIVQNRPQQFVAPNSELARVQQSRAENTETARNGAWWQRNRPMEKHHPHNMDSGHTGNARMAQCPICKAHELTEGCGQACCAPVQGPKTLETDAEATHLLTTYKYLLKAHNKADLKGRILSEYGQHYKAMYPWAFQGEGTEVTWKYLRELVEEALA